MSSTSGGRRPRGRAPAASPDEVLAVATDRYLHCRRIDVQAIAAELGLARATVYRWFGSREELIGEVLFRAAAPLLEAARASARGSGGEAILDTFDRFSRAVAGAPALEAFLRNERETGLRVITSRTATLQPRMVTLVAEMIDEEARAGRYEPPVEPSTLAYAAVKLAEAFLFSDTGIGVRGEVDRLRSVEAALLGVPAGPEPDTR